MDLERRLTSKGRRHAERAAEWLHQRLPTRFALLASPARRAQQTAEALGVPVKTENALAPGADAKKVLEVAGWPDYKTKSLVVVVGHQPDLGSVIAELFTSKNERWSLKKGGLWWLTNRVRHQETQVVIRAVVSPDLL